MHQTPTIEQRILAAATNIDNDLADLLEEAEGRLPPEQLSSLLDKVWLLTYEQCLEANGWRTIEP